MEQSACLLRFFTEFRLASALILGWQGHSSNPWAVVTKVSLSTDEKIGRLTELTERTEALEAMLRDKNPEVIKHFEGLFKDWSRHIVEMRLRQEYETIKGFLITAELAKTG